MQQSLILRCVALVSYAESVDVAKILIDSGADVKTRSYEGRTVLFNANDIELAKFYVSFGVNVQTEDENGNTALFYVRDDYSVVKFLVSHGAKINHKNHNNETPLFNASSLSFSTTISSFHKKELIKTLVENGADVNVEDNLNRTPLSQAVIKQDVETIQYLIENGANTRDLDYRVIEKKYSNDKSVDLREIEIFLDYNRFKTKY